MRLPLSKIAWLALSAATLRADTFYLTIAGLGGEPEYEQRFTGWAKEVDKLLRAEPGAKVETLQGADATKANIEAKLRDIAKQAKADDALVLMLIGHGSYDETDYKFNIPGPDLSATELAGLLDKIPARQLIVNMTSASGGSIVALQKPKRVVVSSTKSGTEKNATVFARYWIEALRDPAADSDKNEVISALEAFRYAEEKTAKFYEEQKRLATEHPLFEDLGKGDGVKIASTDTGEGLTAGRFPLLHLGTAQAAAKDPEKLKLLKHKEEVENAIDELKYRKASMTLADYRSKLAEFLVDLAKTQEALDK
ncbi:MAG TPA: hypothetical protein VGJ09_18275 [Bryobacteraceae bacterium]